MSSPTSNEPTPADLDVPAILVMLDQDRLAAGDPADPGAPGGTLVRERDGGNWRVVYSRCDPAGLDAVIAAERDRAAAGEYELEWKVYRHDTPADLGDRLAAAGFEPDEVEAVLALPLTEASVAVFLEHPYQIRPVTDAAGLDDMAEIAREIGRRNVERERDAMAAALAADPDGMSIHIAYVAGEPVSSGRVYYPAGSELVELAGGRTKTGFRNRGLFSAVVGSRLAEARRRGRRYALVDALPTSEPILRKRGFQVVSHTRPYVYEP